MREERLMEVIPKIPLSIGGNATRHVEEHGCADLISFWRRGIPLRQRVIEREQKYCRPSGPTHPS